MQLAAYHIDAFTDKPFHGNPAAVYVLTEVIPDALMQQLAAEHNLSETAFCRPLDGTLDADYELRWFTPTHEVDLCGHATLATGYVLFEHHGFSQSVIRFSSRSGILTVMRANRGYTLDFPAWAPIEEAVDNELAAQLGIAVQTQCRNTDVLLVTESASAVKALTPSLDVLEAYGGRCVIVSAPGENGIDFVSRVFCPSVGVPEDPVTGSAHCLLTPYWGDRLGKIALQAEQLSKRGGNLHCVLSGERVQITGEACLFYKTTTSVAIPVI